MALSAQHRSVYLCSLSCWPASPMAKLTSQLTLRAEVPCSESLDRRESHCPAARVQALNSVSLFCGVSNWAAHCLAEALGDLAWADGFLAANCRLLEASYDALTGGRARGRAGGDLDPSWIRSRFVWGRSDPCPNLLGGRIGPSASYLSRAWKELEAQATPKRGSTARDAGFTLRCWRTLQGCWRRAASPSCPPWAACLCGWTCGEPHAAGAA